MSDVTRIVAAAQDGDPQAAAQLLPLVYDELRKLAAAKMARKNRGRRCRRRLWRTRRICASLMELPPEVGRAAGHRLPQVDPGRGMTKLPGTNSV